MSGHPYVSDEGQKWTHSENMRKVLKALKEKPHTVAELSRITNLSRNTIYEHVRKMIKDNLIFQKGRTYSAADKGTSLLEKLKALDMTSQLDMTEEMSLPYSYSKRLYELLKEHSDYGAEGPFQEGYDMRLIGKTFPTEAYRMYGVKKINKMRAQLGALTLCRSLKVSLFKEKDVSLNLTDKDKKEIVTGVWNATGPLFRLGIEKFAMLITFDMDTVKDYLPEVTREFYEKKQ